MHVRNQCLLMEQSVDLLTALIKYIDLILQNYGVSPKGQVLV